MEAYAEDDEGDGDEGCALGSVLAETSYLNSREKIKTDSYQRLPHMPQRVQIRHIARYRRVEAEELGDGDALSK